MPRQTSLALALLVAACLAEHAAAFAPGCLPASPMLRNAAKAPLRGSKCVGQSRGCQGARMVLGGSEIQAAVPGVLLAGEIFGQVAAGGIFIILSGVIGAFAVGAIVNLDELEESYREENPQAEMMSVMKMKAKMERQQGNADLPKDVEEDLNNGGPQQ